MLRIFFADYYASTPFISDGRFPMFLEGTINGTDVIHKRLPVTYNNITTYDEYADFHSASIEPESAETMQDFTDVAGINHAIRFVDSSLTGGTVNSIQIEFELPELAEPTRMLSNPVPKPTYRATPRCFVRNLTIEETPSLTVNGYMSFTVAIKTSGGVAASYSPERVVIPYNVAATDDIQFDVDVIEYTAGDKLHIHRCEIEKGLRKDPDGNTVWQRLDVEKQTDTNVAITGTGWNTFNGTYCDDAITSPAVYTPFEPLNDCVSRFALDFFNRTRSSGRPHLILNCDTMKYYKGYIRAASSLFETGGKHSSDDSPIIVYTIEESGFFMDAALTDPNNASYILPHVRAFA